MMFERGCTELRLLGRRGLRRPYYTKRVAATCSLQSHANTTEASTTTPLPTNENRLRHTPSYEVHPEHARTRTPGSKW